MSVPPIAAIPPSRKVEFQRGSRYFQSAVSGRFGNQYPTGGLLVRN